MTPHQRLDQLFAASVDSAICNAMQVVIENIYGFDNLLSRRKEIPSDRWVIHNVLGVSGFFEVEGYSYFWGARLDHLGYAESLELIGFPILAGIVRNSYRLIPPDYLGDWDAVEAHTDSEAARAKAGELMDAKFITENADICGKTARYIRERRYDYLDLLSELENELGKSKL
jgi:hypothetical protein